MMRFATLGSRRRLYIDWHRMEIEACLAELDADLEGLSASDAGVRLGRYGANVLETEPQPSVWLRLFRQFNNILLYVLLGCALLTATLGQWIDTTVIVGVVLINALVGFIQEGRAEQAIQAIRSMLQLRAVVLRKNRTVEIDAAELVPGDLVILQAGDRVVADLRLLDTKHLEVDQAVLTGESRPTPKTTATLTADTALPERANIAYAGTLITRGWAKALVVETGEQTELGQISDTLRSVRQLTTPLLDKIGVFAWRLSLLILLLAGAIALFGGLVHGYPTADMLVAAVSIAVAAIPEGLPPVITITLAIGVQLMSRRHAVVRRLPAVETLGEVDIICTDKTGTLTANEMTARTVITADGRFEATGIGFAQFGELMPFASSQPEQPLSLHELLLAALNCNDTSLEIGPDHYAVRGDPTECALAVLAAKGGLRQNNPAHAMERVDVIPFESEQRFMATVHRTEDARRMAYVKGAPEVVLDMCRHELTETGSQPLDAARWLDAVSRLAADGERVLAFARLDLNGEQREFSEETLTGMELIGIVGTMDPPRAEVSEALRRCQSAGIRVKMITGDHADTAAAVGRELGLSGSGEVITGTMLDLLEDTEFDAVAEAADIFARTSPKHKLRLVASLQKQGHVVAMTGDGVNDAPALKRADVGIAMGRQGTQAAREASEVVLTDDNFASIVQAVETGRNIYENIRKSVVFLLPTSVAEALVIALAILFGYPFPMTPVQILWINMITAVTLGIALAFEPGSAEVMHRSPRASQTPLLTNLVVWRTVFVSVTLLTGIIWLFTLEARHHEIEYARTAAVNLLVLFEAVYLISTRHLDRPSFVLEGLLGNRIILLSIATVAVFQVLFTYTEPFQLLFASRPLDLDTWRRIWLLGLLAFVAVELEKFLRHLFVANLTPASGRRDR